MCSFQAKEERFEKEKKGKKHSFLLFWGVCALVYPCMNVCVYVEPGLNPALWRTLLPGFGPISRRPSALLPALTLVQASSALFIFLHTHTHTHTQRHIHSSLHTASHLTHHAHSHVLNRHTHTHTTHTHTAAASDTVYAISDSPEMVYTLVSLSALNCLLCLVWKGSPRDSAQWPQKCNQPKSPHIIHLFSTVPSRALFSPKPTLRLYSGAPTTCLFSFSALLFSLCFSRAPARAQREGQRANSSALLGGLSIVIW